MNTTSQKRRSTTSKLLAEKDEREILNPTPFPFEYDGKTYSIKPMPDSKLMGIGDALNEISGALAGIAELRETGVSGLAMAAYMPELIKRLVPCSSQIAAVALDMEHTAAQNIPLVKRLELLKLILLAEDAPLLLKKWQELTAIFQPEPTVENETAETEAEID